MKLTQRDTNQIIQHTHDEDLNANRVVLVNELNIDSDKIANSIGNAIGKINFSAPQNNVSIKSIEVPVIVKEYETIYIDRPVIETKLIEIEKPIYLEVLKIIEIEKPIVVKEQLIVEIKVPEIIKQYESIPLWMKLSFGLLLGISLLMNILMLIKK